MTAELIVMIFHQNGETRDVWRALDELNGTRALGLKNAVLIERDARGRAFIQQFKHYPALDPAMDDTFVLFFTNALFTEDAEDLNRDLLVSEFDECFIEELEKAWLPHSSALLIFIPRDSLVNSQRILDYLSEYSGTLMYTTLPERSINSILELSNISEIQA
jgi:uncharacterized membrane protein